MTARPDLAAAARAELAAREKHWPAKVTSGAMTQAEADADIAAWRAIERLFAAGSIASEITAKGRELSPEEEERLKYLRKSWPGLAAASEVALAERLAKVIPITWTALVAAAQRAADSRSAKRPPQSVRGTDEEDRSQAVIDARIAAVTAIRTALIAAAHAAGTFAWKHAA